MSDERPTPFANDRGVSLLAGASADGILYVVTFEPLSFDADLWNYNILQRKWKLLVKADHVSAPEDSNVPCLIDVVYNERFGRVDVFIQLGLDSTHLFRFITTPVPKLDAVLLPANEENIYFDGVTDPTLHYVGDIFIVIGCRTEGYGSILRIHEVIINDDANKFTLLPVWQLNVPNTLFFYTAVAVGNRLLAMITDRVLCFTPESTSSAQRWGEPTVTRYPSPIRIELDGGYFVCPSLNTSDGIWIFAEKHVLEVVVLPDGSLKQHRTMEESAVCCSSCDDSQRIAAAASATNLFWIADCCLKIVSRRINVPTLQYICLSKLCSTVKEFKDCKNEEDAMRLGIPILAWRRFCR